MDLNFVVELFELGSHELSFFLCFHHVVKLGVSFCILQIRVVCAADHDRNKPIVEELSSRRCGEGRLKLKILLQVLRQLTQLDLVKLSHILLHQRTFLRCVHRKERLFLSFDHPFKHRFCLHL